jgi:hypothetical protein
MLVFGCWRSIPVDVIARGSNRPNENRAKVDNRP